MAFTLVGNEYFPSAAYSAFDGRTGAGAIYLAKAGVGPQDGFSGYKAFGDPPRAPLGRLRRHRGGRSNIWIASEYIGQTCTLAEYEADPFGCCGGTRTALANWGTRISLIRPDRSSPSPTISGLWLARMGRSPHKATTTPGWEVGMGVMPPRAWTRTSSG